MTTSERDRANLLAMTLANGFALVTAVAAYLIFSRVLTVEEFAVYAISLALAKALASYFDVCLKTALIRAGGGLSAETRSRIQRWNYQHVVVPAGALVMIILVVATHVAVVPATDALFTASMVLASLLLAPVTAVNTAALEIRQRYRVIGILESLAITIEYGVVGVLFALDYRFDLYVFVFGILSGRLFRAAAFAAAAKRIEASDKQQLNATAASPAAASAVETNWQFAGMLSAYVRDNLPALLIAPLFGKVWAGSYIWVSQLTGLATQVFVASVSRLLVPQYAEQSDFAGRWQITLHRVRSLTALVLFICFALWIFAPVINAKLFDGKWGLALSLLPFFLLRMFWGVATTVIGQLTLVTNGGQRFMVTSWKWTALEVVSALVFLSCFGAIGLAYSYAITALPAIYLWLSSLDRETISFMKETVSAQLLQPFLLLFITLPIFFFYNVDLITCISIFVILGIVFFWLEMRKKKFSRTSD